MLEKPHLFSKLKKHVIYPFETHRKLDPPFSIPPKKIEWTCYQSSPQRMQGLSFPTKTEETLDLLKKNLSQHETLSTISCYQLH